MKLPITPASLHRVVKPSDALRLIEALTEAGIHYRAERLTKPPKVGLVLFSFEPRLQERVDNILYNELKTHFSDPNQRK